ncbi:MAG TPA: hypothetical protein VK534_00750, partial [Methylomirabilota bacterium]|nr:hypothetical protein [Methylomirabilota bacterium]
MRIPDSLVEKLLSKSGGLTKDKLASLHEQAGKDKKPLQDVVIQSNLVTEKDLTKLYADEIEVPFVELKANEI